MTDVAVLAPVFNRPQAVAGFVANVLASQAELELEVLVIANADVADELDALEAAGVEPLVVPWPAGIRGDYARKINHGLWTTDAPYLLCGADDLSFEKGWAEAAVEVSRELGAGFVATNDRANPKVMAGEHATHPLVARWYAEECGTIDCPNMIYHEGYFHQFVDTEATETAIARDCFAYAEAAVVEHRHPIWRTARDDDTYRHGRTHQSLDRNLFGRRRLLWR